MGFEAGRLRHRVTFQKRIDRQDPETGGITPTWINAFENVPAAIEPLSAREFLAAQSLQSKIVARIQVRYRSDYVPSMRILHGSKIYNPEGMLVDKGHGVEYLTMPCSEGVNDG